MQTLDALMNFLAALWYFHFFAFLIRDLFVVDKAKRQAPLTLALAGIFLTCGAHHAHLGLHLWQGEGEGHLLDVIVTTVQAAFAGTWVFLRYESMFGGPGDRPVGRLSPGWFFALGIYGVAVLSAVVSVLFIEGAEVRWGVISNYGIFAAYTAIAWKLFSAQLFNKLRTKWSLSGLVMSGYFVNCGLSHLVFASYVAVGGYHASAHQVWMDWAALSVAILFLFLARKQDHKPEDMRATEAEPASKLGNHT